MRYRLCRHSCRMLNHWIIGLGFHWTWDSSRELPHPLPVFLLPYFPYLQVWGGASNWGACKSQTLLSIQHAWRFHYRREFWELFLFHLVNELGGINKPRFVRRFGGGGSSRKMHKYKKLSLNGNFKSICEVFCSCSSSNTARPPALKAAKLHHHLASMFLMASTDFSVLSLLYADKTP